jgi:endonuclease/exonuclease/phosphatase family metal-dependent hydrolase
LPVRFATFNVENLFARPRAFNLATWAAGQPVVDAHAEFNSLIALDVYTDPVKQRMVALLLLLKIYRLDNGLVRRNQTRVPRWAWLRANRGSFDVDRQATGIEIVADGRADWIGWVELATEPADEVAIRMTARVITDVAADVLGVVEAEDRPAMVRFNDELLASRYAHTMLIDGNDTRGIDVGLMTTSQVELLSLHSSVDTPDPAAPDERLFSRDCPAYHCLMPSGATVWVLLNHFKSQSGGQSGPKRLRQAQGVRDILDRLAGQGQDNLVVMGDLNEGPAAPDQVAPNLVPLLGPGSPVVDVYSLPAFDVGPRPGTFQSASIRNRFDYILLSPALANRVQGGGIERRGAWGTPTNKNPPAQWSIYPEITAAAHAASDHAAVYVDIDI